MVDKSNFIISTRNVLSNDEFGAEPGPTLYLEAPAGEGTPRPSHKVERRPWLDAVVKRASTSGNGTTRTRRAQPRDPRGGYITGDVLVFVHGYNNSAVDVMKRHNALQKNLAAQGFEGAIVSFDWPSAELTLGYLEDRDDARATAERMVTDGIAVLANRQLLQDDNKCDIDVHLLGHSTRAYVIREGFYLASQKSRIARINWRVSQVAFIGADVSRRSLSRQNDKSRSLFDHAIRITNYQNPYDNALKASNVKRLGLAPRAGRVGWPDDPSENVVNVHTGNYWREHIAQLSDDDIHGNNSHSWRFFDKRFSEDLVHTLGGDIDRRTIPTRELVDGELHMRA